MSPLMMRFFTLVGIALAAASLQLKARADTVSGPAIAQPGFAITVLAGHTH